MILDNFTFKLANKITVKADYINKEYNQLISQYQEEINLNWKEEQKHRKKQQQKKLTNGRILNLGRIDSEGDTLRLQCHPIEYKHYLAQRNRIDLGITPLAVSGITYYMKNNEKFFLIGQRSEDVTSYPGYYEFVPSGSIDVGESLSDEPIDFCKQLIIELHEETGITSSEIKDIKAFSLLYDEYDMVYDIGIKIEVYPNFNLSKKPEYREFFQKTSYEVCTLLKSENVVNTTKNLYTSFAEVCRVQSFMS